MPGRTRSYPWHGWTALSFCQASMSPPGAMRLTFTFISQSWSVWWQGTYKMIISFLTDITKKTQSLIELSQAEITIESITPGALTREKMPETEERVHGGSQVNSKWQRISPDTRRWGILSSCFITVIWEDGAVMMTFGRRRSTWGSARLPRGSVIVQLRAAFPPGRWVAMHMPSGPESGHFPSICLFLCNQTRHHLSRVLGEKHHQPDITFTSSLCQCLLNYMVGAFIPLLLYSRKKVLHHLLCGLCWWLSGKESTCQRRENGFSPWVRKISYRRERLPTPVFLPGESHGQRSYGVMTPYGSWGHTESDMTEWLSMHTCTYSASFSGLGVQKLKMPVLEEPEIVGETDVWLPPYSTWWECCHCD